MILPLIQVTQKSVPRDVHDNALFFLQLTKQYAEQYINFAKVHADICYLLTDSVQQKDKLTKKEQTAKIQ